MNLYSTTIQQKMYDVLFVATRCENSDREWCQLQQRQRKIVKIDNDDVIYISSFQPLFFCVSIYFSGEGNAYFNTKIVLWG